MPSLDARHTTAFARHLCGPGILPLLLCVLSSGCLTTLDLSEDFSPSTQEDMTSSPDLQPRQDMSTDQRDMAPTPQDMPGDMPDTKEDVPVDMPDLPPDMPAPPPGQGLFISELVEGASNDKAIEIYNASMRPVSLKGLYMVLLPHTTVDIATGKEVALDSSGITELAPQQMLVLCHGSISDDTACDIKNSFVINFNGDDRIGIFHDDDDSAMIDPSFRAITSTDTLIDSFGHMRAEAPAEQIWENTTFSRCNFSPYTSTVIFDVLDYYDTSMPSLAGLKSPPTPGCSSP